MKILFVAFAESIHTVRWLNLLNAAGFDVHLFPSIDNGQMHTELENVHVYHSIYYGKQETGSGVRPHGISVPNLSLSYLCRDLVRKREPDYRVRQLIRLIRKIQPDIIHSLEFQAAGYLTLAAKQQYQGRFPTWIATNWGSDIFLFGRLAEHREKVRQILCECDYYSCECHRDVELAKAMGLQGKVLPVIPNTGGFDLDRVKTLNSGIPPSARRMILVKGYQGWAGRALVALTALSLCCDCLDGYEIGVYSAHTEDVRIASELLSASMGIPVKIIPAQSHERMLMWFGKSRIYIGLSISDAISTSLLESMAMGAFPIQSNTSCADEWIADGIGGLIVPPEDPQMVAEAIRTALDSDTLVDDAARLNQQVVMERLDQRKIKDQVVQMYRDIYNETRSIQ